jgi:hypothetical protein
MRALLLVLLALIKYVIAAAYNKPSPIPRIEFPIPSKTGLPSENRSGKDPIVKQLAPIKMMFLTPIFWV